MSARRTSAAGLIVPNLKPEGARQRRLEHFHDAAGHLASLLNATAPLAISNGAQLSIVRCAYLAVLLACGTAEVSFDEIESASHLRAALHTLEYASRMPWAAQAREHRGAVTRAITALRLAQACGLALEGIDPAVDVAASAALLRAGLIVEGQKS